MSNSADLSNLVKSLTFSISKNLVEGTPSEDFDSVAALCEMRVHPTGKEDPKSLVRRMANKSISSLIAQYKRNSDNSLLAPIYSFFFMEWCYRQDYLKKDWSWKWNIGKEGEISYFSEFNMKQLESKLDTICLRLFYPYSSMEVKCSKCGLQTEPGSGLICRSCRDSTAHPFRMRIPSFSELEDRKSFPSERRQTLWVVATICFLLPVIMSAALWAVTKIFGLGVIFRVTVQ